MIQRQLSPAIRMVSLLGGVVLSITMAVATLSVALRWRSEPSLVRTMATIGLAGVLALALVLINMARRGIFDRRRDNHLFAAIVVAMTAGLGWSLIEQGLSAPDVHSLFAGAVLMMLGGLSLVLHLAEQQYFTAMEKLHELKRRISDQR